MLPIRSQERIEGQTMDTEMCVRVYRKRYTTRWRNWRI